MLFEAAVFDIPIIFERTLDPNFVRRAEMFYTSLYNAPKPLTALLHGVLAIGILGISAKLHRWTETDIYFGVGSACESLRR